MNQDLFRREVIDARRGDWLGQIALQAPRFGWIFLALGASALLILSVILFAARYTQTQSAVGTIRSTQRVLDIKSQSDGIVSRLLVKEGQHVHRNDPVAEVTSDPDSISFGLTRSGIAEQLLKKRLNLLSEIKTQKMSFREHAFALSRQAHLIGEQEQVLARQINIHKNRINDGEGLYKKWETLSDSDLISKAQLLEKRDSLLQMQSQVEGLKSQQIELQRTKSDIDSQVANLPYEEQKSLADLTKALADVEKEQQENAALLGVVIRAQEDGIITNILINRGERVVQNQKLLTIVPQNSNFVVELWVPSNGIGFISEGNAVTLRYRSFPYQRYGVRHGTVTEVSQSGVIPQDMPGQFQPDESIDTYYRVMVAPNSHEAGGDKTILNLLPGMKLDADIAVDTAPIIDFILQPIRRIKRTNSSSVERPNRG